MVGLDNVPLIPHDVEELPEHGLRAPHERRDYLLTEPQAVCAVGKDDDPVPLFP